METYELIITAAIGLAVLLFGYRLKKVAFFVIWFVLGYFLMNNYLMGFIKDSVPEIANDAIYQTLLPIGGGLILALLGFTIEQLCVSGITFALVLMTAMHYFGTDLLVIGIAAVVGVILGALAVRMMKPATIIATSGAGAYALTLVIFALFTTLDKNVFYLPIIGIIAILGCFFQFSTTKHVS